MRYFEQRTLVSDDGKTVIMERVYSTGEVEYWGVLTLPFATPQGRGQASVPFIIGAVDREAAFENYEKYALSCRDGAKAQVRAKLDEAARPKIVVPGMALRS